jgi:hypothetical protein
MDRTTTVKLIVLIVLLAIILLVFGYNYCVYHSGSEIATLREEYENMDKIPGAKKKWSRSPSCAAFMNSTTYDCLKECLIEQTANPEEADIVFPCGYNNIENEIRSLPHVQNNKKKNKSKVVFIIEGADEFSAKDRLWRHLLKKYGLEKTRTICPTTYILIGSEREKDIKRLKADHNAGSVYIMKKNLQRQEGLKITTSLDEIIENEGSYNLVQELLQNSYLINGRKINLRVYIVVVCHKNQKFVLVFDDGFMYYTKNQFVPGDQSMDNHVTTGYIDREVYIHNPLTLKEFRKYLDLPEGESYHPKATPRRLSDLERKIRVDGARVSDVVFDRIHLLIREIFEAFTECACRPKINRDTDNPIYSDYGVEIFGADIAIDNELQPKVMEINKGPDLHPKDDRDSRVKKALVHAVFGLVGLSDINNGSDLRLVLKI